MLGTPSTTAFLALKTIGMTLLPAIGRAKPCFVWALVTICIRIWAPFRIGPHLATHL